MELVGFVYLAISILGGALARFKKDYFSRGFFICLFTGIFGLFAIILSPLSAARDGDEKDQHGWPKYGGYAVLATIVTALFGYIII